MGLSKRPKKARNESSSLTTPRTVDCSRCGEPIIIPKQCKHGKKLINCTGSDCSTAHILNHNIECHPQISKSWTKPSPAPTKANDKQHDIIRLLIMQEIDNLERMRGKEIRYLNGIPKAEFVRSIPTMSLEQARMVAQKLKNVGEGTISLHDAMYDDEESDSDQGRCQTPHEEDGPEEKMMQDSDEKWQDVETPRLRQGARTRRLPGHS